MLPQSLNSVDSWFIPVVGCVVVVQFVANLVFLSVYYQKKLRKMEQKNTTRSYPKPESANLQIQSKESTINQMLSTLHTSDQLLESLKSKGSING